MAPAPRMIFLQVAFLGAFLVPLSDGLRLGPRKTLRSPASTSRLFAASEAASVGRSGPLEGAMDAFLSIPKSSGGAAYRESESSSVTLAIRRLQKDLTMLDDRIGREPQLERKEFGLLLLATVTATVSPWVFSEKIVELLVPALAALAAAIGIGAEYTGKTAVFEGKEVAAVTLQAAAEAEQVLSRAERVKAVMPLCVGVSTCASAFALLAPEILHEMLGSSTNLGFLGEAFLLVWPFISVVAAAVTALASQEVAFLSNRACNVGLRRMATRNTIANTWLSGVEMVQIASSSTRTKWVSFAWSIIPAPVLGVLFPGPLAFKAVIVSVTGTAQAAYYLTKGEYQLARAIDRVAEKLRCAALADVYANQSARAGSILPFTSALSGLCVAAAAAIVELNPALGVIFPGLGALFAAAASVSKAQAEVDTAAACAAATDLAEPGKRIGVDQVDYNDPGQHTRVNMRRAVSATYKKGMLTAVTIRRRLLNRFFGSRSTPAAGYKTQTLILEDAYRRSPNGHKGGSNARSERFADDVKVLYETPYSQRGFGLLHFGLFGRH